MSCLAGILIVVSYDMSEYRSFRSILKGNIYDRLILLTTFLVTIFIDLVAAIEIGVVLSSLFFMKRMSDIADKRIEHVVDTDVLEDYSFLPGDVRIFEISGPLFFGTAKRYAELMKEAGMKTKVLIIRMRHVDFVDQTGMKNLFDTLESFHRMGVTVIISGMNPEVKEKLLRNGITRFCTEENLVDLFRDAVERARVYSG